jgi:2-isopropylmalate synthase
MPSRKSPSRKQSGSRPSGTHSTRDSKGSSADAIEILANDWNSHQGKREAPQLLDETLRDGLQSPSVRDPPIEAKLQLVHKMVELGIDAATIGIPCARARQRDDVTRIAREIADCNLPIVASCAARTRVEDIVPIIDVSQRVGISIEVAIFIGSSPLRQYVDGRSLDDLKRLTERAVQFAAMHELPVMFITEDTTRSTPDALRQLYGAAIRSGADRICIADTVGHATPEGASRLVEFVAGIAAELDPRVRIDWHGHRDRGLSVANCLAAWGSGADRCHGTALGVGERCGNTPMELLLVNLQLQGWIDRDLTSLSDYAALAAHALRMTIPPNAPVVGADAFRTATGVHASAILKASQRSEPIGDTVYSGVPAAMVGRSQVIEIGPMSGRSNVRCFLEKRDITATPELVDTILGLAKQGDRVLSEGEVLAVVNRQLRGKRSIG